MTAIRHVEVVIPARDEQDHIATCLTSVRHSILRLRREHPGVSAGVTVVLDSCTDGTRDVVRQNDVHHLTGEFGCVGSARRVGAAAVLDRLSRYGVPLGQVWLAGTDADTIVPDTWLLTQVLFADNGMDAVIGTVTPQGLEPQVEHMWHQGHALTEGHAHVHGANLGLRASTYVAAGGFADLAVHEDHDLVRRVKQVTACWVATHQNSVSTSGRSLSRVDGGFASYVAALAEKPTCA